MRRGALVFCLVLGLAACDGPPSDVLDAAVADAFHPPDAFVADAALPDAPPIDAAPPGAAGEPCAPLEPYCLEPLYCQWLETPAEAICTVVCLQVDDCADFGVDACCAMPGVTSAYRVCQPAGYCRERTLRSSSSTSVAPTFTP